MANMKDPAPACPGQATARGKAKKGQYVVKVFGKEYYNEERLIIE